LASTLIAFSLIKVTHLEIVRDCMECDVLIGVNGNLPVPNERIVMPPTHDIEAASKADQRGSHVGVLVGNSSVEHPDLAIIAAYPNLVIRT